MGDLAIRPELGPVNPQGLKRVDQQLAVRQKRDYQADYVHHWSLAEVKALALAASNGRDKLLVEFLR